jgi:hypothetical protein
MADALDAFMEAARRIIYCSRALRLGGRARGMGREPAHPDEARAHRAHPYVSCFYWDSAHDVAVAECRATWIEDDAGRREAWERLSAAPEPMGYDPAPIWPDGPEGDDCVALRLDPGR